MKDLSWLEQVKDSEKKLVSNWKIKNVIKIELKSTFIASKLQCNHILTK
jgi:hypothetical protein